jgi:hypothetical protein
MTEEDVVAELEREPFYPFRLHLVSGKVLDVLGPNTAHPLTNALLVLRNPIVGTSRAEGYDVIAYYNIERLERLQPGKAPKKKRKSA